MVPVENEILTSIGIIVVVAPVSKAINHVSENICIDVGNCNREDN
jgi:hypothetical protein